MLMTKAAYARHKGVSRQTFYDRIARGELVLAGGKIDASASEQKATDFVTSAQDVYSERFDFSDDA